MSLCIRFRLAISGVGLAFCAVLLNGGCVLPGHWKAKKNETIADSKAYAESNTRTNDSGDAIYLKITEAPVQTVVQTAFAEARSQSQLGDLGSLEQLPEPEADAADRSLQPLQSDREMLEAPTGQLDEAALPAFVIPRSPRDASQQLAGFRDLSDTEMISIALANSPVIAPLGIRILDQPSAATTVFDRSISATDPFYGPQAALAQYDSQLAASLDSQNNDRVFNNATLGGNVQQLTQDYGNLNLGWQKRMLSGGTVGLNSITTYDSNNRQANSFPSYWDRQLEASIRQPLARGAGRHYNLIAGPSAQPGFNFSNGILIARLNNQISDADFEIALRRFVHDLYSTYWELASKYENYDSINAAADLAYKTWQTTLAKRDASLEGGEANREAEARAKFYRYRRELQLALGGPSGLYVTERQLRVQMGLPLVADDVFRPSEAAASAPIRFDFDALVSEGLTHRTELQRQSIRVQQQQLRLVAARNFLLPQVDAIGRYRMRGFGDDLYGSGPQFSSANQDLFSLDHQEFQFGVEMGVTVGRRQAHAAVQSATLLLHRERAVLQHQQREIEHEVSNAYAAVMSAYAAFESSSSQVEAARQRLAASQALFESDKLQIEFLLDAQADLLQAEQFRISDQSQYTMSLVQVTNSTGQLLHEAGINTTFACQ